MDTRAFAERLNRAREKKGLSLRALSQLTDITPQSMSQYARGETAPPLKMAVRMAKALEVSLDWLCGIPGSEEAAFIPYKTYGDVARALFRLAKATDLEVYIDYLEEKKDPVYDADGHLVSYIAPYVSLKLLETRPDVHSLIDFFVKLDRLEKLAGGKYANRDIVREWVEGRLAILDAQEITPIIHPYTPITEVGCEPTGDEEDSNA